MMKRNILKITSLLLGAVLACSPASGCGMVKETHIDKDGATLELSMDNSWHTEKALPSVSHSPQFSVGTHVLCLKEIPNRGWEFLWYDLETKEKTRFFPKCNEELEPLERLHAAPVELPDGKFGIVCMIYQGKGGGEFDVHRRCMEVYDQDLNFIETREIPVDFFGDTYFYPTNCCIDKDGNWFYMDYDMETGAPLIHVYNSEFEKYGVMDAPSNEYISMFTAADGTAHACYFQYDQNHQSYQKVYKLDAESRTCTEVSVPFSNGVGEFVTGTQGYDFYYSTVYGMYGVKGEESTEILNWLNSDFSDQIWEVISVDNGDFMVYSEDEYWHAQPRSQEEIDGTKLISLAVTDLSDALMQAVVDYNRAENGYRIIVKDYGKYDTPEEPNQGYDMMKTDMMNGIIADMICTDGLNFESLASKGLFTDWYEIMDSDPEFHREDYLQNFFETYEYDGKLQRLGVSYTIVTGTAKTEYAGDTQGLSLGEQLSLALPEGMDRFMYQPAEYLAEQWMQKYQTGTINRETAECYFDSPDFVKLLEELASIPQGQDFYLAQENGEYAVNNYELAWREDWVLFNELPIAQPIDFREIRRYSFFDADITLTGYPMVLDDGNGGVFDTPFTVSVNAESTEQTAIWNFMKHLLSEDYQKSMYESMPIHEGALEFKFEEAEGMVSARSDDGQMFIGEMERWESDILRDYIHGIRSCTYYDWKVYDILMEEAEKMLAGDQTPQQCAEMMQSRVSIYLSEQS